MSQLGKEIYVLGQGRLQAVLFPDSDGVPTLPDATPFVISGVYLAESELETGLSNAATFLSNKPGLLVAVTCPEGPPYRSFLYYAPQGSVNTPWRDSATTHHGSSLLQYEVTTMRGSWQWLSDHKVGRPGYFMTGHSNESSLWRVFRLESDAFGRSLFTLAPVRFVWRCPSADFSKLGEIGVEVKQQYEDLCRSVVQGAYRDVVTKARNIIEAVFATRFDQHGRDKLFDALNRMKEILDKSGETGGYTYLEYHVAQKIRLVHARTHPTSNRPLPPEFALGVIEDLVFLLTECGFISRTFVS